MELVQLKSQRARLAEECATLACTVVGRLDRKPTTLPAVLLEQIRWLRLNFRCQQTAPSDRPDDTVDWHRLPCVLCIRIFRGNAMTFSIYLDGDLGQAPWVLWPIHGTGSLLGW